MTQNEKKKTQNGNGNGNGKKKTQNVRDAVRNDSTPTKETTEKKTQSVHDAVRNDSIPTKEPEKKEKAKNENEMGRKNLTKNNECYDIFKYLYFTLFFKN